MYAQITSVKQKRATKKPAKRKLKAFVFHDYSKPKMAWHAGIYKLLQHTWWPHPIHGSIDVAYANEMIFFSCACGMQFGVPEVIAAQFGLVSQA